MIKLLHAKTGAFVYGVVVEDKVYIDLSMYGNNPCGIAEVNITEFSNIYR